MILQHSALLTFYKACLAKKGEPPHHYPVIIAQEMSDGIWYWPQQENTEYSLNRGLSDLPHTSILRLESRDRSLPRTSLSTSRSPACDIR